MPTERKKLLLRLDPAVHDALARWAGDELRSTNAQIEFLLRRTLGDAGRMPGEAGRIRRPGRPPAGAGADDLDAGRGPGPSRHTDHQTAPDRHHTDQTAEPEEP